MEKLKLEDINWENQHKLYRGTFQHQFMQKVLESAKQTSLSYVGTKADIGDVTNCTVHLNKAESYVLMRSRDYDAMSGNPFSQHPMILEINAEPYQDRLLKGIELDEVLIIKPIDLDDIRVLFSSRTNTLEENHNLSKSKGIDFYDFFREEDFKTDDLITNFEKDEQEVLSYLNIRIYGAYQKKDEVSFQKARNFIEIMSEKLKGK